jgi:Mg-chelatase subunit ChlD
VIAAGRRRSFAIQLDLIGTIDADYTCARITSRRNGAASAWELAATSTHLLARRRIPILPPDGSTPLLPHRIVLATNPSRRSLDQQPVSVLHRDPQPVMRTQQPGKAQRTAGRQFELAPVRFNLVAQALLPA